MKSLFVLRHAKTQPQAINQRDYDRQLTDRGRADSDLIGQWLQANSAQPAAIISSSAARARETTEQIHKHLGLESVTTWEDGVYSASAEALLSVVRSALNGSESILLVGHNPGLEQLVSGLCCGGTDTLQISLPTAGLVYLEISSSHWSHVSWGDGTLHWCIRPKLLR